MPNRNQSRREAHVSLKRAYAAPTPDDGTRVLVDRIWPRGLRKDRAKIDMWLKDIAPSTELRHWFHEDSARWSDFKRKYRRELADKKEDLETLRSLVGRDHVTLLFASADVDHNNAVVLRDLLKRGAGAKA